MNGSMTVWVKQDAVCRSIAAAFGFPNDVVAMPASEGCFSHHMSVVPCPSSKYSIELTDEVSGGGLLVVLDDPSHFVEERLDVFL
jgi:hypothetical protein